MGEPIYRNFIQRLKNPEKRLEKPSFANAKMIKIDFAPYADVVENIDVAYKPRHAILLKDAILTNDEIKPTFSLPNGATTRVYDGHKGVKATSWAETKKMALVLNKNKISVAFLPERHNQRSADALLKIIDKKGSVKYKIADFKYCSSGKVNTLTKELREGAKQAKLLVVKIDTMDTGRFLQAINYLRQHKSIVDMVLINKKNKMCYFKANVIRNKNFGTKIRGFL